MRTVLVAVLALSAISTSVTAQAPDALSFQGLLTDSLGSPLDSTGVSITFKLYKNNVAVWTEMQTVDVNDGIFNVLLGKVTDLSTLAFDQPIDLGIKLDGEASEISPRTPLVAAAFAKALPGMYTFYHDDGNRQSYNVVGGAENNVIGPGVTGATIGGGGGFDDNQTAFPNMVLGDLGTVSGGSFNTASGQASTVGGGKGNTASKAFGTISGGQNNTVGYRAVVGGGFSNEASSNYASIGGGSFNTASGLYSTVPGGFQNSARGTASFAAGHAAKAVHNGTFVWNDRSITGGNDSLLSTGPNQFLIRAAGGVAIGTNSPRAMLTLRGPDETIMGPSLFFFGNSSDQVESGRIRFVEGTASTNFRGAYIRYDGSGNTSGNRLHIGVHNPSSNSTLDDIDIITIERSSGDVGIRRNNPSHPLHVGTTTSNGNGAYLSDDGMWTDASSRSFKMDFADLDKVGILEQVAQLPVTEWSYKEHISERHIGPVAEDFYETFGLGSDNKYIGGSDASGVALAAIQGLYELVQELQAEVKELRAELR